MTKNDKNDKKYQKSPKNRQKVKAKETKKCRYRENDDDLVEFCQL
jgi:hypothetical protein